MYSSLPPTQSPFHSNFTRVIDPIPIPTSSANETTSPLRWFVVEVLNGEDTEDNINRWSSFIGIIIAISGNILISLALNIQKYAHVRLEREAERRRCGRLQTRPQLDGGRSSSDLESFDADEEEASEEEPLLARHLSGPKPVGTNGAAHRNGVPNGKLKHLEEDDAEHLDANYIASPYWWAGLIMMFFGECGNFLGYGFAPASIISPLGVVALISNCVIAPLMLKEPFRKRDLMGVLVSVAGAVVVVWSAEKEETKLGPDEILDAISQTAFEVYFGITCALIIVLMRLSSRYGHKTILIDLGLVGLFGGYTVLATKGISSLISSSFYHIFQYPIAYLFTFVLASTAVLQVKYINRALQRFDSTQVIPTQFVLFTISVIVGSAILYRDFEDVSKKRVIKFCAGCSLTFIGVYLISSKRQHGASRSSSFTEESDSDISSDLSGSHIDSHSGIPIPPPSPAIRPPFYRTVSAVSSNAVSLQGTPTLSSSPEALAQGLQTAAQDSLFSPQSLHSHHHHHHRKRSETEAIHRALGLAPGSNLMTGYQLQSVLADRVTRARTRDGEREESEEGEATGTRGRSSSLSLMLDFVKGKLGGAAGGEEAGGEEDNNGEEGRA